MKIQVQVRQKKITIDCGDGTQTIQWLADTAVALYDLNEILFITGEAKGIKYGKQVLSLSENIKSTLKDGQLVNILLSQDIPQPKISKRR